MRTLLSLVFGVIIAQYALAIDNISCLAAKSRFKDCAKLSEAENEDLPLRSCLDADSGYTDCRLIEGMGSHTRCLPAKGQFKSCMEWGGGNVMQYNDCLRADSGFNDCVALMTYPRLCLGVKGGYKACRESSPAHSHQECVNADNGYADCMALGGNHLTCIAARRSYKYCKTVDQQSMQFCAKIGKGYMECRQAGFSLAHCNRADQGFADCAAYEPPQL